MNITAAVHQPNTELLNVLLSRTRNVFGLAHRATELRPVSPYTRVAHCWLHFAHLEAAAIFYTANKAKLGVGSHTTGFFSFVVPAETQGDS